MKDDKLLTHTPIFDLVEIQDDGSIGFNPVKVNSHDWITIIVEKDGQWLMETQMRYGLMSECLEFPSGIIEKDEYPIDAAIRELAEETGYVLTDKRCVHYLGQFAANPAFMSNRMHYFHVNLDYALYDVIETSMDCHEKIESFWMKKEDVINRHLDSAEKGRDTNVSVFVAGAFELMRKKGVLK